MQVGNSRVRLLLPALDSPITAPVLDLMRRALDRSVHPNKVVLWAISCAAFFGFFHLGKLLPETAKSFRPATDLLWGDIAMDNPSNPCTGGQGTPEEVQVRPIWQGVRRHRPHGLPTILLSFIALRGDRPGPFFLNPEHGFVAKAWFTSEVC